MSPMGASTKGACIILISKWPWLLSQISLLAEAEDLVAEDLPAGDLPAGDSLPPVHQSRLDNLSDIV